MLAPIAAFRGLFLRLAASAALASVACSVGAQSAAAPAPGNSGPAIAAPGLAVNAPALTRPAPAVTAPAITAPAIALLLPSQQSIFASAAEAVRQGFFEAHKIAGSNAVIQVIETDDDFDQLGTALLAARDRGVRVAVGPLRRDAVNAIVDGGRAVLPLVTLNFPEREAAAPLTMIALGLSAESEAERVVQVALSSFIPLRQGASTGSRIIVLAGAGALDRRIAQAYVTALRSQGEDPLLVEANAAAVGRLARQFETGTYDAVFLALGAREASVLRSRIPRGVAIFGTSLLNVGAPSSSPTASALAFDLEGVRFVDMPWLLQPDHPAVMVYPAPARPMALDTARLYALGVDAYRIAQEWMKGESRFEIDGVTGRLRVHRAQSVRVERIPTSAIYRNGVIEREEFAR